MAIGHGCPVLGMYQCLYLHITHSPTLHMCMLHCRVLGARTIKEAEGIALGHILGEPRMNQREAAVDTHRRREAAKTLRAHGPNWSDGISWASFLSIGAPSAGTGEACDVLISTSQPSGVRAEACASSDVAHLVSICPTSLTCGGSGAASSCIVDGLPQHCSGGPLSSALRDTSQARSRPTRVVGRSSSSNRSSELAGGSLLRGTEYCPSVRLQPVDRSVRTQPVVCSHRAACTSVIEPHVFDTFQRTVRTRPTRGTNRFSTASTAAAVADLVGVTGAGAPKGSARGQPT